MTDVDLAERRYYALLRERDELTYQIGVWNGFIEKKRARIEYIDEELTKYERRKTEDAEC